MKTNKDTVAQKWGKWATLKPVIKKPLALWAKDNPTFIASKEDCLKLLTAFHSHY